MKKPFYRNSDFFIGVVMLFVFGITMYQILSIKIKDSRIFPTIAAVIMGFSGFILIISTIKRESDKDVLEVLPKVKQIAIIVALLIAYVLFSILGFYVTLFLLLLAVSIIIVFPMNKFKWFFSVFYSLIVTAICYLVFNTVLGLLTPYGIFI